jgi:hypothetical protein
MAAKWAKLTVTPGGAAIFINLDQTASMERKTGSPNHTSVISAGGLAETRVLETPEAILTSVAAFTGDPP